MCLCVCVPSYGEVHMVWFAVLCERETAECRKNRLAIAQRQRLLAVIDLTHIRARTRARGKFERDGNVTVSRTLCVCVCLCGSPRKYARLWGGCCEHLARMRRVRRHQYVLRS